MSVWVLDGTGKSITVVMTGAPATTQPDYATSWIDENGTTSTPGANDGTLNGTTPVTVIAAPASGYQRIIKAVNIYNVDTASVTFYVKYVSGGTRILKKVTLLTTEVFTIEANYDSTGAIKTAIASIPVHDHTGAGSGGTLSASNVFSAGQVPLARGGTNADLSATGGTGQYLKQASAAAAVTVGVIADADLPNIGNSHTITVKDANLTIQDDSDTTKQLQFQLSGITTSTTRTATAPDKSGTLAMTSDLLFSSGNVIIDPSFEFWDTTNNSADYPWALTGASATIAREATIIKHGLYSAKLTRSGADATYLQDIYIPSGSTFVRSRTYTFGAWVYATVASRVRLRINDGVTTTNSSYHTGGSAWEWLTVTATLGAAITTFKVGLEVITGDTSGYIDACAVTEGSVLTASAYPPVAKDGVYGRMVVSYSPAANTNGGTYTATAYATRPLNTIRYNTIQGASLASNQVSLPVGIYRVRNWVNGYATNAFIYRVRNVSDSVTLSSGLSGNNATINISADCNYFLLTGTKLIELQQAGGTTRATDGMGTPANLTENETYSIVEFEKVG